MSLAVAVAGNSVNINQNSLKIDDDINYRSVATFDVQDSAGASHFANGQPVTITDSVKGLLFAGFVDVGDEDKLIPNPNIVTAVTAKDNHYIPEKRRLTKDYQNMAAGDIATDMLSNYLAAEGITSGYAYQRITTQYDFATGSTTGPTTIGHDTFARANQSGFGTATDGQAWSQLSGTMTASISSNEGTLTGANSDSLFKLGTTTSTDVEAVLRFKVNSFSNDLLGPALRIQDANNFYRPRLFQGNFSLTKVVGGTLTILTNVHFLATAGTFYWIRYRIQGTTHYGKVWQDGTTEPANWTTTTTDTSITAAGNFGIEAWTNSGSDTITLDSLTVITLTSGGTTSTNNVGDGDLELAPAGSTVVNTTNTTSGFSAGTLTSIDARNNQINLHASNVIKLTGTVPIGGQHAFVYWKFWSGSYAIASGNFLEYDVWISSTSPSQNAGVDFVCTDGSRMISFNSSTLQDQYGIYAHPDNSLSGFANDQWYHRKIDVTAMAGKTISYALLAFDNLNGNVGNYQAYFRNVAITNGASNLAVFYDSTTHPYDPQNAPLNQNSQASNTDFANVTTSVITAYDQTGTWTSPAISVDVAKVVNSSLVSWTSVIPAGIAPAAAVSGSNAPLTPAGTMLTVNTSIDGQITFEPVTYLGAIPDLEAGMNVAGRNVYGQVVLAITGTTPEITPALSNITLQVTSAFVSGTTNSLTSYDTTSDFNTGANSTTHNWTYNPNGNGDVTLDGMFYNWFTAGISNQTLFGANAPSQKNTQRQLNLGTNSAADVKSRLEGYGGGNNQFQNFTASVMVQLTSSSTSYNIGLVYRTTGWLNANDTYAYCVNVNATTVQLGHGTNGGASTFTSIATAAITLTANNWYNLTVIVNGNNHQVLVDGAQYINATDATYTAAGQIGLRVYNNTGGAIGGFFQSFGVISTPGTLTGTWTSPSISLNALGTIGNSAIFWNSTVPNAGALTCASSIDGGATYQAVAQGGQIGNLPPGTSTSGISVKLQFTFTSPNASVTPALSSLSIWAVSQATASASWVSPVLSLNPVGRAGSTFINWTAQNATSPRYIDTFAGRTTTAGQTAAALGTSSDGHGWVMSTDTHATIAVANNEGNVFYDNAGSGSGTFIATLGSALGDVNVLCRFSFLAATGGPVFQLYGRYQNTSNYYTLKCNQSGTAQLSKNVAGVSTNLGTALNFTFIVGASYWARFQIEGSTLAFKVWTDGTLEPATWAIATTDSALSAANPAGIGATVAGTTAITGINFDSLTISAVNLAVDVSPDNSTWTDVTGYQGAALPSSYIFTQPSPWLDFFPLNTSANYTSTNYGTGANGTWTWDTANNRLIGSGGTRAILQSNQMDSAGLVATRPDGYIEAAFNWADGGGLFARQTDSTHLYYLVVNDASAGSNPNTLQLFKFVAGTATQLGSNYTISFVRGDYHVVRLDIQGSTITAYFDSVQAIQQSDSAISGAGNFGYLSGNKIQALYARIQAYGDNQSGATTTIYVPRVLGSTIIYTTTSGGKNIYTRLRLSTSDPTITPQVLDTTLSVHNPNIQSGVLIPNTNYAGIGSQMFQVSQALDDLAKQCNTFIWYVGNKFADNMQLFFHDRQLRPSPYYVYSGGSGSSQGTGGTILAVQHPKVTHPDMLYRNQQTIDGGIDTTSVITYTPPTDGRTKSWPMAYPLNAQPTIALDGVAQTVGVAGVDTGKQFYYQVGSNIVSQDPSGTPPTASDTLTIVYVGQIPVRVTVANVNNTGIFAGLGLTSQQQLKATDNTSGIVEDYQSVPGLNRAAATNQANALLIQYGKLGTSIQFLTNTFGLAPGQLLVATIVEHGIINQPFLISKVQTTVQQTVPGANANVIGNLLYSYTVDATTGPAIEDWTRLFQRALQGSIL